MSLFLNKKSCPDLRLGSYDDGFCLHMFSTWLGTLQICSAPEWGHGWGAEHTWNVTYSYDAADHQYTYISTNKLLYLVCSAPGQKHLHDINMHNSDTVLDKGGGQEHLCCVWDKGTTINHLGVWCKSKKKFVRRHAEKEIMNRVC